ncbi:MAG: right-handed parallel beta-helix repeat-containing protein, partial [bacterium]
KNKNITKHKIHGLDNEETYVFWITAYDHSGRESGPSNEKKLNRASYRSPEDEKNSDDRNGSDSADIDIDAEKRVHIYPGQSIQAAIEAADNGDEIIIHQGVYREKINFIGKALTVKSTDPDDPVVVAGTIIDGADLPMPGSIVTFMTNEGGDSILNGITIRNGNFVFGGGIYCSSSPTIINCTISGNSAKYGGAVCCLSSSATIANCVINNNKATLGGGIFCLTSSSSITNCTIKNNSATSIGGIYCFFSSLTVTDCTITKNSGGSSGGIACLTKIP